MQLFNPITRKELRTYFLSPVALIFIATFLLSAFFAFFWIEGFFSRNLANIRPLFEWLPILLLFLVPALGMRLWSEEDRMGTIELLQTFPIGTGSLVISKFIAGLALITVALALTFSIPLTVNLLGNLDWGPVWGGYLATILLAAMYLAITLCISAMTSSQLIALVFSSLACGLLYLVGSPPVVQLFGTSFGEILRSIGAGSRFESILRGVIDLRDILYYASLTTFFLLLNTVLLEARRWSNSPRRKNQRFGRQLSLVLIGLNLLALNIIVAPQRSLRIDLTEQNEFTISDVTKDLLKGIDEPLLIRGYFSNKTHPLLAPLVPRIRDIIEEYGAIGGNLIRAEFVDPTTDPELEKEATHEYGVRSIPFQFADRHETSVVNSFFNIVVRYGDQIETLSFNDLIEVQSRGMDIDIRLRNLEYDLTRTIQKVKYGFQSIESVISRLPSKAKLTAFITSESLPEPLKELPERLSAVGKEFEERGNQQFSWEIIDPDAPNSTLSREEIFEKYRLEPITIDPMAQESFYLHLILEVGDFKQQLVLPESIPQGLIRGNLLAALKRAGHGSLKTIGWVTPQPQPLKPGMPGANYPGAKTNPPSFRMLKKTLAQTYEVREVDLSQGSIPGDIDILLNLDPRDHGEEERFAIDQFLMRGGSAIIATSKYSMADSNQFGGQNSLGVQQNESGLTDLLAHYGVEIDDTVVLDKQNAAFPIPVTRNVAGIQVEDIQMISYPGFVDIAGDQLDKDNIALSGLPRIVMHWASPVTLNRPSDNESQTSSVQRTTLMYSSPDSWTVDNYTAHPDFMKFPKTGWETSTDTKKYPLAVSLMGTMTSFYADSAPEFDQGAAGSTNSDKPVSVIKQSPEQSRLVVLGSASFVTDWVSHLNRGVSDAHLSNFQLIQNLTDWCLEDVALLSIRSRGNYARTLISLPLANRRWLEWGNYLVALLSILIIGLASLGRRHRAKPLDLSSPENNDSIQYTGDKEPAV